MPDIPYPRMPMPPRVRGADEPAEAAHAFGYPLVVHETTFQKNRATGLYRAKCTCGWFYIGEERTVYEQAAAHDMWVPV